MRCLFHVPYRLEFSNPKGGAVRPVRMLRAFQELAAASGGEVTVIAGTAAERKAQIATVKKRLAAGERWDFCYSESSTMPTTLTEPHHLPTHPLLDFAFFATLRRAGIAVGLFYRDIQWRFPIYKEGVDPVRRIAAVAMYRYDLLAYGRTVDVLFLPSLGMADHVPLPRNLHLEALPPGHEVDEPAPSPASDRLELFYVGGISNNYRLQAFVEAVSQVPEARLVLCCRDNEWANWEPQYRDLMGPNIEVVHAPSEQLAPLFAQAQVGVLAVEPVPYWAFAAPLKMYEYLGNGLPMIASEPSLAGDFVRSNEVGWTRPHQVDAFVGTLRELAAHPERVAAARDQVLAIRDEHSWLARARQVQQSLTGLRD